MPGFPAFPELRVSNPGSESLIRAPCDRAFRDPGFGSSIQVPGFLCALRLQTAQGSGSEGPVVQCPGLLGGPGCPGSRRRRRRRWRRRQGEASSGSSSPAPRSLAVLEGPWRPQRDIIRTNSAVGAGGMGGGGEKAAVRVQDTAPHLPQIDASLPVCGHHL